MLGTLRGILSNSLANRTQRTEATMIVTRRVGETIRIGEDITLTILTAEPGRKAARLGIDAPRNVPVDRAEVRARKDRGEPPPKKRRGRQQKGTDPARGGLVEG